MATLTTSDGTTIHYDLRGQRRPPLVFVHGWCSRGEHWSASTRHFGRRHQVLAFDRRGHGRSDPSSAGYQVERHGSDLIELMVGTGLTGAVLVAHAGGGPTVLEVANRRPDLVQALVLIECRLGPALPGRRSGLRRLVHDLRQPDGAEVLARTYRSFFRDPTAGRRVVADAMALPLEVVADELESLAIDSAALAATVSQPVVWFTTEPADQDQIGDLFRDVRFVEIADSGHFPQIEAPDATNAAIEDFLNELSSTAHGEPGDG